MRRASDLEHLLCKSKFIPVEENCHVNSCGKNLLLISVKSLFLFSQNSERSFFSKK